MVGAFALNLQIANHVIYFESPIGCIPRDQSERRCWRKGQTKKVLMYDLVMDGGVDERILAFHQDGLDIFQSLTHEPRKVLK